MPTDFATIRYDDPTHTYWIGDTQLTSVTNVLSRLYPIFEKDKISRRVANKRRITQEAVLAEWDKNSKAALQKGTIVHAYAEDILVGRIDPLMRAVSGNLPEVVGMDAIWAALLGKKATLVEKEKIVGDLELGVAGRVDAIILIEGVKRIFDWKTGKFDVKSSFNNLLPPFQHIGDCKLNRYSLQTSLYRLILERNTGEKYGDGYIGHLPKDGVPMLYRCHDFRSEVEEWLLSGSWKYDKETDEQAQQIVEILGRLRPEFFNKISELTQNKLLVALDQASKMMVPFDDTALED